MTKEEILAMEAGLPLDILVAKTFHLPHPENILKARYYSTGIPDAWRVVEKMRGMEDGEGNQLLCCLEIYSDHDLAWELRWSYSELSIYNDGHKKHRSGCFDDLPEAICKAALLVKLDLSGI